MKGFNADPGWRGDIAMLIAPEVSSSKKSGLPTTEGYGGVETNPVGDVFGDEWTTSSYEQRHNVKLVGGYRWGDNTFSGRLQYYSGFPYTPYIDGVYDTNYFDLT